jgi:hypothetical protein
MIVRLSIETRDVETGDITNVYPLETISEFFEVRKKYERDRTVDVYLVLASTNAALNTIIDEFII